MRAMSNRRIPARCLRCEHRFKQQPGKSHPVLTCPTCGCRQLIVFDNRTAYQFEVTSAEVSGLLSETLTLEETLVRLGVPADVEETTPMYRRLLEITGFDNPGG